MGTETSRSGDPGARPGHDEAPGAAGVEGARLDLLTFALHEHTSGLTSGDATVACCWDADRLNLWRVGIAPRAEYLSGAWARRPERIAWGRRLQDRAVTWEEVCAACARLVGGAPPA